MGFPSVVPFTGAMRKLQIAAIVSLMLVGCGKKGAGRSYIPIAPTTPYDRGPNDLGGREKVTPISRQNEESTIKEPITPPENGLGGTMDVLNKALEDALFDFNRYTLRPDATTALTKNADSLRTAMDRDPTLMLRVEGHCDERGSSAYNLALGDRRAQQAKEFLHDLGIPAERMVTVSYGEEAPVCTDSTEGCWQQNRRAHVTYFHAAR